MTSGSSGGLESGVTSSGSNLPVSGSRKASPTVAGAWALAVLLLRPYSLAHRGRLLGVEEDGGLFPADHEKHIHGVRCAGRRALVRRLGLQPAVPSN
ncbi:hypothetical protein V5799_032329 [Amblyomma americanum]|uniref:Uncharacterized protein n=1 Tax=Amblyomma americanum TaxID=6943 RepID=A0AAQ4DRH3_AMBAM